MIRRDPLWRALGLLRLSPGRVLASIAAGVVTLGSALALAALSAWLITRAWERPPVLALGVAVVAVRALGISRGVFRYVERLVTHDTALRGLVSARAQVYERLAEGAPGAVETVRRGDLLARTGADLDAIGDVVIRALVPIGVAVVLGVAATALVAVISPGGALVLALALAGSGIVAPALSARAAVRAERAGVDAAARYSEEVVLALEHAPALRVSGALGRVRARAAAQQASYVEAVDRAARPAAFAAIATPLAIGVSVLGALLIGIDLYARTAMSPMSLAIAVLVPLSAFEATGALPDAAITLTRSRAAARRVMALLDESARSTEFDRGDAEVREPEPAAPWLAADRLRAGWSGGPVAARPVDLSLRAGSRVAVTGGSGCGKTTLLMTLAGVLPPLAGAVEVGGYATSDWDEHSLRRQVCFFAEDAHLFDTSLRENLRVVRGDVTDDEIGSALDAVGLGEWVDGLADGLDTTLAGGADAVSGGQRRRLLLARALLSPARVLLLDEPTEHLDARSGEELLRRLLDRDGGLLGRDRAVVVVTHQLPDSAAADVVLDLTAARAEIPLPAP